MQAQLAVLLLHHCAPSHVVSSSTSPVLAAFLVALAGFLAGFAGVVGAAVLATLMMPWMAHLGASMMRW
jgi:hypothetical protein